MLLTHELQVRIHQNSDVFEHNGLWPRLQSCKRRLSILCQINYTSQYDSASITLSWRL